MTRPSSVNILAHLATIVGANHVLQGQDSAPFTTDITRRHSGQAVAVVRPQNTAEVCAIMRYAHSHQIPVVPQSGNTSLCGGGIPDRHGQAIVLSLRRMNHVREVQAQSRVVTVEAGVILQQLQDALSEHQLMFPLDFGAKGSCMIGGNLSTNAGGSNVLRYGNTRDLCLGLEVVLADGQPMNLLTSLHKDNTGYDLKDLFIGAEGTLGIITAATLQLAPVPRARSTAFLSVASPADALIILNRIQDACNGQLDAFEIMSQGAVEVICRHVEGVSPPFDKPVDFAVLAQVANATDDDTLATSFETVLAQLYESGTILDAVMASSEQQRLQMWKLREGALEGNTAAGPAVRADVSFPLNQIQQFIDTMRDGLSHIAPAAIDRYVGHLGDGNLHYSVALDDQASWNEALAANIDNLIMETVIACKGSISAEHGIGVTKREQLAKFKDPVAMQTMKLIKKALDPLNIMNPGKVL